MKNNIKPNTLYYIISKKPLPNSKGKIEGGIYTSSNTNDIIIQFSGAKFLSDIFTTLNCYICDVKKFNKLFNIIEITKENFEFYLSKNNNKINEWKFNSDKENTHYIGFGITTSYELETNHFERTFKDLNNLNLIKK